jgi:hypothetical protein
MKAIQSDKLKRIQTLNGVLDELEETWNTLPAFARAVTELETVTLEITEAAQVQLSAPDVTAEKRIARTSLTNNAEEVAAAVLAYAEENDDAELAGRVDFSRSKITRGRDSTVVARCRDIHAAAVEIVTSLTDSGVTTAKLTALKKQIDGFEALHTKPRQNQARRSAATRRMPILFEKADRIVNRRLNKLVLQFKTSAPAFFNAYQTAVTIVNTAGRGKVTDIHENNSVPLAKAA